MLSSFTTRVPFKESIIYQIYPASFCDSNNDGYGDLNGIRSKLDYLQSLGADVLWLSPIYKSPLKDMGYDISDYKDIDGRYGTLEDWDALVADLHSRGMKLMMDLVVNHTSDQHEWFLASRSSTSNPKRDWYIWRPAKYSADGQRMPPNNWASEFGGSAWEWDEHTQEYYLHLYVREQPDLNWENPDVREAVWELMLWWLRRGADGFRMDVINLISKTAGLPDADVVDPSSPFQPGYAHFVNGPKVHDYIQEMHIRVLSNYPSAITVGESPFSHDAAELIKYVHPSRKELNMIFQFELADLDSDPINSLIPVEFTLPAFKRIINKWQRYMYDNGGWNTVYLENHDLARSVSRFLGFKSDSDNSGVLSEEEVEKARVLRAQGAKLLAILQTTLGGTMYVYQGQELGLANVPRSWGIEEYKDVATVNFYNEMAEKRLKDGDKGDMSDLLDGINKKARDNARTPMHWNNAPHGGFTTASQPWMRVNDDYTKWNAEAQVGYKDSVHTFWKSAIALRKSHLVLTYGDFVLLSHEHESIFAYTRTLDTTTALIIMNFSPKEVKYSDAIVGETRTGHLVNGNVAQGKRDSDAVELGGFVVTLEPYEGRVYCTMSG